MLLIPCPDCGERDESEFDYGGRAVVYPALDSSAGEWHQVLHLRDNPPGEIDEYWYHAAGCECWITVKRNLVTHEIVSAESNEANS
ncbi:MAG: sarcosine oxidase subunit delta [Gammaproteobacteria bacterium]|nr:sarcosine oxidase subunit delta [Gammaproteobacteria bacterium]